MNQIWTLGGTAFLLLLTVDVFLTVFHTSGQAGPLTRLQNRVVWRVHRFAADRGRRTSFLTFAAPAMVVITIIIWVILLTVGFALIYYPQVDDFVVTDGDPARRWIAAFYFSGYTGATLGLGDILPDSPMLRILTPIHAFSGFALLSASVTYLLGLYRELIAIRSLAHNIAGYLDVNGNLDLSSVNNPYKDAFARWIESITSDILRADQACFQYPILHYFRPERPQWALSVQLDRLYRAAQAADHPSIRALRAAIDSHAREVVQRFIPSGERPDEDSTDERLARMLQYMSYR
jgi:hypothetical protein